MSRRKKRRRRTRPGGRTAARVNSGDSPTESGRNRALASPRRRLTGWKKWALRIVLVFLPALLFLGLELVLRLAGYGVETSFLLERTVGDETKMVNNPKFTWQFFGPDLARDGPPFALAPEKPAGTCRVFVLGGSAAMGFPEKAFGMARALEVMLRNRYPGVQFEVVNTGITAINSHVVRLIAEECRGLDPDVFVVYLGNNEVVGPYGAGTVFAPLAGNRSLLHASRAFQSTRVGQLLGNAKEAWFAGDKRPETWRGMEMFLDQQVRASDAALEATYRHFEANLRDICRAGERSGVPVILSTVPVNVKGLAPFASLHRTDLSREDVRRWEQAHDRGKSLEKDGRFAEAIAAYEEALALDDEYAELLFRLARCHWKLEKFDDARALYEKARDLDTLRFRADARINAAIRRVAAERAGAGVTLADAQKAVQDKSPHGVPGNEAFYEHVHLRFRGTYLVARALCDAVEPALPAWVKKSAAVRKPLTLEKCADHMAYTPVDRNDSLARIIGVVGRPPFRRESDHADAFAAFLAEERSLRDDMKGPKLQEALATYRRVIDRGNVPTDLRTRYVAVLLDHGDLPEEAERQLREVTRALPARPDFSYLLAECRLKQGRLEEAVTLYRDALRLKPHHAELHNACGLALQKLGRHKEAASHYESAVRIRPDFAKAHSNWGLALAKQGRYEEAVARYQEALRIRPQFVMAHVNWGNALQAMGRYDEAVAHYKEALRIKPDLADAHSNWGDALLQLGQVADAVTHFREAVRIDPDFALAHNNLGAALARQGRLRDAIEHFKRALRLDPGLGNARGNLRRAQAELRQRNAPPRP